MRGGAEYALAAACLRYLNLPMFFEGQLDVGVLAVLVGTRLLVGRGWIQVDNYFCTVQKNIGN